jgi:hypothetical protein
VLAVSLVQSGVKDNLEAGAELINCFSYLFIQTQDNSYSDSFRVVKIGKFIWPS